MDFNVNVSTAYVICSVYLIQFVTLNCVKPLLGLRTKTFQSIYTKIKKWNIMADWRLYRARNYFDSSAGITACSDYVWNGAPASMGTNVNWHNFSRAGVHLKVQRRAPRVEIVPEHCDWLRELIWTLFQWIYVHGTRQTFYPRLLVNRENNEIYMLARAHANFL